MPAGINTETADRGVVEITWDTADYEEGSEVTVRAVNPETGEESDRTGPNDGSMTFTYPTDFSGTSEFTIWDDFGNKEVINVTVEDGEATGVEAVSQERANDGGVATAPPAEDNDDQ